MAELGAFLPGMDALMEDVFGTMGDRNARVSTPWWAAEIDRLRPNVVAYARRRTSSTTLDREDVANDVAQSVAETLSKRRNDYPTSWFGTATPPETDRHAFRALLWRIARRRLNDALRRRYLASSVAVEAQDFESEEPDQDARLDAKRVLRALAVEIESLSDEDRDLLYSVDDADADALSPSDRVRLHRLRRQLARSVLGQIANEEA